MIRYIYNKIKNSSSSKIDLFVYSTVVVFIFMMLKLSFGREVLNYDTETDFLWQFIPEAQRFLKSEQLILLFHPPLYPIVLSLLYKIVEDWMKAGLIISITSSLITLISCYVFFKHTLGARIALSSLLALTTSIAFISYTMQATSEMLFFAFVSLTLLFMALSSYKKRPIYSTLLGVSLGLAVLTRTNGIFFLGLMFLPQVNRVSIQERIKLIGFTLLGIIIPLMAWYVYAINTDSQIYPKTGSKVAAVIYNNKDIDHITIDSWEKAKNIKASIITEIQKDYFRFFKTYTLDLKKKLTKLVSDTDLIAFPFTIISVIGFIFAFIVYNNLLIKILGFYLVIVFLMMNMAPWAARYHLYIIPFIGVGIYGLLEHIMLKTKNWRLTNHIVMILICLGIAYSTTLVMYSLRENSSSLSYDAFAASKNLKKMIESQNYVIIARKQHLSYYTGSEFVLMPNTNDLDSLGAEIKRANIDINKRIFLFYGLIERSKRPQFMELLVKNSEKWLKKVASGEECGGWKLYEIDKEKL